jgi:hypothetical protein
MKFGGLFYFPNKKLDLDYMHLKFDAFTQSLLIVLVVVRLRSIFFTKD